MDFSKKLSQKGFQIISGLALGIDTYAHLGNVQILLQNKQINQNKQIKVNPVENILGNTIAVLGCGIDKLYPTQNRELANWILKTGGCIISEYPKGTNPLKENFPQRNRIISGLSNGVLVVEAGEKSGAIITANIALEQGKDVFAIPGNINSPQSFGTNKLIYDGAIIVTSVKDIIE